MGVDVAVDVTRCTVPVEKMSGRRRSDGVVVGMMIKGRNERSSWQLLVEQGRMRKLYILLLKSCINVKRRVIGVEIRSVCYSLTQNGCSM